jgi:hypothetical protein
MTSMAKGHVFGACLRLALFASFAACGYPEPGQHIDAREDEHHDDAAVDTVSIDAWEDCLCNGTTLSCPSGDTACAASCLDSPAPHCAQLIPSNTVDRSLLSQVSTKITFSGAPVIDSGTGAITGGSTRAAGTGVNAGIGYTQVGALGIFTFDDFEIPTGITVRVIGTKPVVFLIRKTARITGTLDASGNQSSINQAGPGGGSGAVGTTVAGGCGAGGPGESQGTLSDSGGGGGGGGAAGGKGGDSGSANGGTAGASCIPLTLEPLTGGSGGGVGAKGDTTAARGGGGGGAVQISALESIIVTGTIDVGGGGGEAGQGDSTTGDGTNAGGGGGGGSGGGLLLEAPINQLIAGSILAANAGAGGGAGDGTSDGMSGASGVRGATVAKGGTAAVNQASDGGDGGFATTSAKASGASSSSAYNGGGGGGAVGRIFIRAKGSPTLSGTVSPPPGTGSITAD